MLALHSLTSRSLHIIRMSGSRLLIAASEVECYQSWQYAAFAVAYGLLAPAPLVRCSLLLSTVKVPIPVLTRSHDVFGPPAPLVAVMEMEAVVSHRMAPLLQPQSSRPAQPTGTVLLNYNLL